MLDCPSDIHREKTTCFRPLTAAWERRIVLKIKAEVLYYTGEKVDKTFTSSSMNEFSLRQRSVGGENLNSNNRFGFFAKKNIQ